jgi:hypothetical protein
MLLRYDSTCLADSTEMKDMKEPVANIRPHQPFVLEFNAI